MYTIKRAAELTGLSVTTLRAWERRYGIVSPQRTESGYRLYDAEAVHTLSLMNSLVLQGWSPRQAAAETVRRRDAGEGGASDTVPPAARDPAAAMPAAAPAITSVTSWTSEGLIDAAAGLDVIRVAEILDERFSVGSFETVVDSWLLPALVDLGEAWAGGRVSVAGEHLVAYAVQRRLAAAYEAAAHRSDGPRVIIGLPAGARHELGLLAFATAARRVGLTTAYVGADLPTADWVAATAAHDAVCAVLSVPRDADLASLRSVVASLRSAHPPVLIAVGGSQQDRAPKGCLRLGHDIGEAASVLADALASSRA